MKQLSSLKLSFKALVFCLIPSSAAFSQVICSEGTPYFFVDLSGNPDSLYLSPSEIRDGSCCGSAFPDRCVEFTVILDNSAVGLSFNIYSGAQPPGALFYQIDCGQTVMVGEPICLQGGQQYTLTFCKPGANENVYSIQSIRAPISTDTITTRVNCPAEIHVEGPVDSTVVWNDITSPDGRYNAYLSCLTGCDTTMITPGADAPPVLRYEVCGVYVSPTCNILPIDICDTVVVYVKQDVQVGLEAGPVYFCEDNIQQIQTSINLPGDFVEFNWYDSQGITGGGPPLASGEQFTPPGSGTYWVVATDTTFAGCNTDTASVSVVVQPLPQFSFPGVTQICFGASQTMVLQDGITYTWSPDDSVTPVPGTSSFEIAPTDSTTYTITAEDNVGCTSTTQLEVQVIPEFGVTLSFSEVTFCADDIQPVEAQLTGVGGDVTFEWYNAANNQLVFTGQSFLPAASGNYYVVATNSDFQACNVDTASVNITIQPLPVFQLPESINICEGTSAVLDLQDGFTYTWSPSSSVTHILGTNSYDLHPFETTTYTVTAQNQVGCTYSDQIIAEVIPAFGVAVSPSQYLFCQGNVQPVHAQLTGIGGNVTFGWYNAVNNQFLLSGQDFLPPSSGSFYVVATHNDFQACNVDTATIQVTIQPLPEFDLPPSITLCEGESKVFELQDGISYIWSPASSVIHITGTNFYEVSPVETTTYTVTAQDFVGCAFTDQITVNVVPEFGVTVSPSQWLFCEGNIQPIQAQLTGQAANVTYRWYNAVSNQLILTSQAFLPQSSGNYYVVATNNDTQVCNTDTAFVSVTIQPLPDFSLQSSVELCGGESLTVNLPEGPTYFWAPSTGVTTVEGNHVFEISPTQSTNYTVTAQDFAGCSFSRQLQVNKGPEFGVAVSPSQVLFCGDEVQPLHAHLTGAGGNVTFRWYNFANQLMFTGQDFLPSSSGSYSVVAVNNDFQVCNVDTAQVQVTIQPLPEFAISGNFVLCPGAGTTVTLPEGPSYFWLPSTGVNPIFGTHVFSLAPNQSTTYTVTAVDNVGCSYSQQVPVEVVPEFGVTVSPSQVVFCENDVQAIEAELLGSGGNFTFLWYDSIRLANGNQPLYVGQTFTPTLPGQYAVVAVNEDYSVCNRDTAIVSVVFEPVPQFNLPQFSNICSGNPAIFELPPDFTYTWLPGTGVTQVPGTTRFLISPQSTTIYTVVAENAIGCTYSDQMEVRVTISPVADAGPAAAITCTRNAVILNGSIANNGPAVSFNWSGPNGGISQGAASLSPTVIIPGTYYLTASNGQNGCSTMDSVVVGADFEEPLAVLPEIVSIDCGANEVLIDGSGSTSGVNIEYNWASLNGNPVNEDGTPYLVVSQPGSYSLTVTNLDNGCQATDMAEVVALPRIEGLDVTANKICADQEDGSIAIGQVLGGTPPYSYSLNGSPFVDLTTFNDLKAGTYSVNVMDANGCHWQQNVTIGVNDPVQVNLGPNIEIANGEVVELNFETNIQNFLIDSILWAPAAYLSCTNCPSPIAAPLFSTLFSVEITDINGCSGRDEVLVELVDKEIVYIPNGFTPNGDSENDRFYVFTRPGAYEVEFLKIFDRWGNMVFEAENFPPNDPQYGWDGTFEGQRMNPAVFVYFAKIKLENGTSILKKGDVTLVRW